jgi:hypothetical protein
MGNRTIAQKDIRVERSQFNTDPERYMRQASQDRRVVVHHDGSEKISAIFGGALNTPPSSESDFP